MTKQEIIDQINEMTSSELVALNNTYADAINSDSQIYSNDEEFFELFYHQSPMEVARAVCFGDYNYSHDWVEFDGYGNLKSYYTITTDDLCERIDVIADYIIENPYDFNFVFIG